MFAEEEDGCFHLTNLAAGNYLVVPFAPGLVMKNAAGLLQTDGFFYWLGSLRRRR
ncbi:MAG: hypothetical protein HY231_20705 [Acidobacteria bacterium]|nr:hypothetical protein [Acidobacteriota bacterium]